MFLKVTKGQASTLQGNFHRRHVDIFMIWNVRFVFEIAQIF